MTPSPGSNDHDRYVRIQTKFIAALTAKGYPLPITPQTKMSDLNPSLVPIVRLINKTFFPDNRFTTGMISPSDTIQNVSLQILHLDPPKV